MSDNTPLDGKKNSETDATASPDETARGHAVPEPAEVLSAEAASPEPVQEPLVIDYDAINANLTAAERADAATASANSRNLSPMSTAEPVASADVDAPSLADDYADSYTPAATVSARSTAIDSEPVVTPSALLVVGTPAAASTVPVDDVPVDDVPVDDVPVAAPAPAAPAYAAPAAQSPIYVQAPTKPRLRSNRGGGILIALLATVVFALLYAAAAFIIIGVTSTSVAATVTGFTTFAALPVFYIPILFFFLAYVGLIALVNRGGWWAYVLFGFIVAVVVYFSYIGGALLGLVFDGTADTVGAADLSRFVSSLWLNPGAIAAGLIAREVPIWAGAWIARRGRRVTARNLEARTEYERLLADGPHPTRP
ncbi:hypothetical protein [Cryobacterium sp. M91]|uniref:hypothetical protein n=1 Tax=Cryobacterium sp. M91 TaxID=2048294 RepID=UPI000CE339C4|nr:hypothetical protein [Cryobacterium sp. M91]